MSRSREITEVVVSQWSLSASGVVCLEGLDRAAALNALNAWRGTCDRDRR